MFTKVGKIVALLAVFGGMAAIVGSFFFPFDINSPDYRTSFNFRQATVLSSQGMIVVLVGLVLGILCEISTKLEK